MANTNGTFRRVLALLLLMGLLSGGASAGKSVMIFGRSSVGRPAGRLGVQRLRGGADAEEPVEVEAVAVEETAQLTVEKQLSTKRAIEKTVAEIMEGTLPEFVKEKGEFQHVIRILNTNIDGRRTILYALTAIKGVGRRFSDVMCKRAGINSAKRAGELTPEEIEKVVQVLAAPEKYDIPSWMLNRRKDYKTGKDLHNHTNYLDLTLREDLDRMRKARVHRGLRHAWGFKVRGQHTKTGGRGSGRVVPRSKKPTK